ncbi:methyl-accepting chemotaxis protein [Desulfarculus baarsii]
MKLSLRNRFLLPTVIMVLVGFCASSLVSYLSASSALERTASREIAQIATLSAKMLDWWIKDRQNDLANWSAQKLYGTALQESFMGKAARKEANETLQALAHDYKYYESINLCKADGVIVASSRYDDVKDINLADRPYFSEAIKGTINTSEVVLSRTTGQPTFIIAAPVKQRDEIIGVLAGVVDLAYFNKTMIESLELGQTGYAYIYDQKGRFISHPDKSWLLKVNVNDFDYGRDMMTMGSGAITYEQNGVEKTVAFQKVDGLGWTVGVGVGTDELLTAAKRVGWVNLIVAVVCIGVVGAIIFFIATRIAARLKDIADGLSDGATQVSHAAAQMATASQQLAEGSSEQASSLEESSASLEQMAAMTRQNADSAQQADSLMRETNQYVAGANTAMNELTTAMGEISAASESTSKIIKTIDEIAFQTNLLALNAAVEAARAGEAGAGFAVVADEVRNLAMRAAEAAKTTADLIEGTVQKVKDGTALVDRTAKNFGQVSENTNKVGELVGEIAAASKEQSQGIDQVNQAISQMDKLTQSNAANAEESAASSEQMNAQAESMKDFVAELAALILGAAEDQPRAQAAAPKPAQQPSAAASRRVGPATLLQHKPQAAKPAAKSIAAKSSATVKPTNPATPAKAVGQPRPEDVIPFDDEKDFQDF